MNSMYSISIYYNANNMPLSLYRGIKLEEEEEKKDKR